jgi:hypothetical protein
MAPFDQPVTSYSDTTPHKRMITDVISIIDPSDTPAIMALGGLDGASGKFRFVNEQHTKCEWLEDTLIPLADTLDGSITSTVTTITVDDGSIFQPGHVILIGSEQLWVSSVSSEVVTVTRAFQGTAASAADAAAVTIVGMARLEGADSDSMGLTDRTTGSNYTQIFQRELKVSRTHSQLAQYGISDEMSYQEMKAVPELMRLVERDFFYSTVAAAGSATTARAMSGVEGFVTDNKVSGSTLAQSQFEDAVQAAWDDGGSGPWLAFLSSANYQTVKNFYDSSNFLRVERGETVVGMVIDTVRTPFGDVKLVLDRWAKGTIIPIIDPKHAGFKTYYPFTWHDLAIDGDYDKAEVVGEFTLCIRQDKAHALLTNVS